MEEPAERTLSAAGAVSTCPANISRIEVQQCVHMCISNPLWGSGFVALKSDGRVCVQYRSPPPPSLLTIRLLSEASLNTCQDRAAILAFWTMLPQRVPKESFMDSTATSLTRPTALPKALSLSFLMCAKHKSSGRPACRASGREGCPCPPMLFLTSSFRAHSMLILSQTRASALQWKAKCRS
jgi:hypothetical protein